jgi:hypothetical protein
MTTLRLKVVTAIRCTSVVLVLIALVIVGSRVTLIALLHRSTLDLLWRVLTGSIRYTYSAELRWAVPILVGAIALWLFQRPLARLIVPTAGRACPECGYSLRNLKGLHCPECGWEVPQTEPKPPAQ